MYVCIYNEDSILEQKAGTGDGGAVNVDFDAVPAGYYYEVVALVGWQAINAPSSVLFALVRDSTLYILDVDAAPAANIPSVCANKLFAKAGDVIRVRFAGTTAGRALTANLNARKIPAE